MRNVGYRQSWIAAFCGLLALLLAAPALAAPGVIPDLPGPSAEAPELSAGQPKEVRLPGHYIVVLEDSVKHPTNVAEAQTEHHDGDLGFVYRHALKGYSAKLSRAAVAALRKNPQVDFIEPVRQMAIQAQSTPYGIARIGAAANPSLDIDGVDDARVNVDVAVIDTGIDYTHPDLNVFSRTNCVPANEDPSTKSCVENSGVDGHGHGTHVAGTVGAIDNGFGVVGAAPGARLWAVRVLNAEGEGWDPWILAGIDWVTAHAAQIEVANMSIGGPGSSAAINIAVKSAVEAGVVMVAAAGNSGTNSELSTPANSPDVITVSALAESDGKSGGAGGYCSGADDSLASFSNWGRGVEIAAPGTCVFSTVPGATYANMNGTSMASPHVAGAAAVLAAKNNPSSTKDVEAIRQALVEAGSLDWNDTSGDRRLEPLLYLGGQSLNIAEAATGALDSVDETSATLYGSVATHGEGVTSYRFDYGLTQSYGKTVTATREVQGGSYSPASATVTGLEPGRTYHYRLVVVTPQGNRYGADRTFQPSLWHRIAPSESPPSEQEHLLDVSCSSSSACAAVGRRYYEGYYYLTSYVLDGGKWTYRPMPVPTGAYEPLVQSVSCTDPEFCIAVGQMYDANDVGVPLVEVWNGSSWSPQSITAPPGVNELAYAALQDLSCAVAWECMAVGYYLGENPEEELVWKTYSASWDGSQWSNEFPQGEAGFMESVSCLQVKFCASVGDGPLWTWNGTQWSEHSAPAYEYNNRLTCISASFCLTASAFEPYMGIWDGSDWSISDRPAENESFLFGLSCLAQEHCVVSGSGYKPRRPLVELWDGAGLRPQATIRQAEMEGILAGVDCDSWGCIAVGTSKYIGTESPLIASAPDWRPGVVIKEAAGLQAAKAVLRGTVDPNGVATSYVFEWGTTASYGHTVTADDAGAGLNGVDVSKTIEGLESETTYHYRLVASGEGGTARSADRTFTTPAPHPPRIEAEAYPASLQGEQEPTAQHLMKLNSRSVTCQQVSLKGEVAPGPTLPLTAEYTGCTVFGREGSVDMNSCRYDLHVSNAGPPYTGTVGVSCTEANDSIVLLATANGSTVCTAKISPQSIGGSVSLANVGEGKERAVALSLNLSTLKFTMTGPIVDCGMNGARENGTYTGGTTLKGSKGGSQVAVFTGGEKLNIVGTYLAGQQSAEEAKQPRIEAETYPASLQGEQEPAAQHLMKLNSRSVTCQRADLSGEISGLVRDLPLTAEYTGCTVFGREGSVDMNSCRYDLHVSNAGPPYTGTVGVSCTEANDSIVLLATANGSTVCTAKISPQSIGGSVSLANVGEGKERAVALSLNLSTLKFTMTGPIVDCGMNGARENGTYTGGTTLYGFG